MSRWIMCQESVVEVLWAKVGRFRCSPAHLWGENLHPFLPRLPCVSCLKDLILFLGNTILIFKFSLRQPKGRKGRRTREVGAASSLQSGSLCLHRAHAVPRPSLLHNFIHISCLQFNVLSISKFLPLTFIVGLCFLFVSASVLSRSPEHARQNRRVLKVCASSPSTLLSSFPHFSPQPLASANTRRPGLGKTLSEFRVPVPTLAEVVRAYDPEIGHRPEFLESFPQEASDYIVHSLQKILQKHFPGATKNREGEVAIIYLREGQEIPKIKQKLLKKCPFILEKYPNGPSDSTIRHLMSCPATNRLTASRYKGLIKAKLALGQNNKKQNLPLVRFTFPSLSFNMLFLLLPILPSIHLIIIFPSVFLSS